MRRPLLNCRPLERSYRCLHHTVMYRLDDEIADLHAHTSLASKATGADRLMMS